MKNNKDSSGKKIGLIAPFLTHYRIYFYNRLQLLNRNNLVYYFQQKEQNDGRPGVTFQENSSYKTYSNKGFALGSVKPKFSIDLIKKVKSEKIGLLIIEGATSNLTSWYFIALRRLLGIKIISWACAWQPETHSSLERKVKILFERIFFNNVDWILTYSTTAEEYLKHIGVKKPITTVYNGIDINEFGEKKQQIEISSGSLRKNDNRTIFLYVGGMFAEKKVNFLLDCFSEFKKDNRNSALWLIGDGPLKSHLEQHVSEKEIEDVVFFGRIEADADRYFAAADFSILPGVGGLALNQAMLWGTPCIVSEADGTENDLVLDGETGFRFQKDNKESLIGAMKKACSLSHAHKIEMSAKAQQLILLRSNTDKMAETFTDIIRKLTTMNAKL